MPVKPALTIDTGDISHLSKPEEFDLAQQLLSGLNITELHTVPGEHDVTDGPGTEKIRPLRPGLGLARAITVSTIKACISSLWSM